jgi:hypothetical protein
LELSEAFQTHVRLVIEAEAHLQLPSGFLRQLLAESDWSFVIKAHAVVEAAITQLLVAATRDPRLTSVFERLPLGGRTGKVAFVKAMGLIDDAAIRFATRLSEVRNRAVHDVRSLDFTFQDYIAGLTPDKLKSFAFGIFPMTGPPNDVSQLKSWPDGLAKFTVFLGLTHVLIQSLLALRQIKIDDRVVEMDREYAKTMRELYEQWQREDAERQ